MAKKRVNIDPLDEETLLCQKVCDLDIKIKGTDIELCIQQLYNELSQKEIHFQPECYLSDEWFSPENVPAIAIPFFLAHPKLRKLEQKFMLEVEGETHDEFMQLLRHEAGHAIEHAFRFRKTPKYRKIFNSVSKNYAPDTYRPRPYSRSFVHHLPNWYAQAHPDEDFAETFAVWLTPDSNWQNKYRKWKALQKLQYVDQVMKKIRNCLPKRSSGEKTYRLSELRMTLQTYYKRKRKQYAEDYPDFYDADLKQMFSMEPQSKTNEPAHRFLRRNRKDIIAAVAHATAEKKYTVSMLVKKLIERSQTLRLRVSKNSELAYLDIGAYLATLVTNNRFTGKFKRSI